MSSHLSLYQATKTNTFAEEKGLLDLSRLYLWYKNDNAKLKLMFVHVKEKEKDTFFMEKKDHAQVYWNIENIKSLREDLLIDNFLILSFRFDFLCF